VPLMNEGDIPEILNEMGFQMNIVASGVVTHNPPCVPHCTVCYPCQRCGLIHALGRHDQEETA